LIFLVHFPIANLALCLLFARTARGHSPIAARLAAEVIGLRCPAVHQSRLHGFFQGVTVLWAGVFLLLAVILGVLLATVPISTYVPIWAVSTVVLIVGGIAASVLWLRSVLRRLGIGFRFVPVTTGEWAAATREASRVAAPAAAVVTALASAVVLGISAVADQRSTKQVQTR